MRYNAKRVDAKHNQQILTVSKFKTTIAKQSHKHKAALFFVKEKEYFLIQHESTFSTIRLILRKLLT